MTGSSLASSWVSSTSTHQTSRPRNAFGTMIVSRFSLAWVTTSTMSSWHHGVSSPLMRIARTVRPQSSSFSAAMALVRAASLSAGAHGVFQVEEHQVGFGGRCVGEHVVVAGRNGELRAAQQQVFRAHSRSPFTARREHAGRRFRRRAGRAVGRTPRRCAHRPGDQDARLDRSPPRTAAPAIGLSWHRVRRRRL